MNRWRPSPEEERWLAVASRFVGEVPDEAVAGRDGGWRRTGPLARVALFVLGLVAASLLLGILGFHDEITLLVAGLVAAVAAEWLTRSRRLFASGIEEGLCVAGYLLVGIWMTTLLWSGLDWGRSPLPALLLIVAVAAAGLRCLNPFVTTCAAVALTYWVGSTVAAQSLDAWLGAGMTVFTFGLAVAALALAAGSREILRPSHDRMLDWLVAVQPVAACSHGVLWGRYALTGTADAPDGGNVAAVLLLLVLAAAMLYAGLRRRRHAPLIGFLACAAGLAIELRASVGLANETWLILCGLVALVAGASIDRYLRVPRDGLTSTALSGPEEPLDLLQSAGAAVLAQRTAPQLPSDPDYAGGGGRFGGGGASGRY